MRCVTLAIALTLGLAGCWSSPSVDARVEPIVNFVKAKCSFIVDAAAVAAMLASPDPITAPTVKSIGTAICITDIAPVLSDMAAQVCRRHLATCRQDTKRGRRRNDPTERKERMSLCVRSDHTASTPPLDQCVSIPLDVQPLSIEVTNSETTMSLTAQLDRTRTIGAE